MSKRSFHETTSVQLNVDEKSVKKHTLDSDEEEDDIATDVLSEEKIEGQEIGTIDYDEGVEIIPFNMKQELADDGHFDSTGNFIFKKESENTDDWLESVDWKEVKEKAYLNPIKNTTEAEDYSADRDQMSSDEKLKLYQELIKFMREKESVLRTIKRLGESSKSSLSASQRWSKKVQIKPSDTPKGDPKDFLRATEVADTLLQGGDFGIYQKNYKEIDDLIRVTIEYNEDDALDKLGEAFDDEVPQQADNQPVQLRSDSETKWEIKNSNDSDHERILTTKQLIEMKNDIEDSKNILVRKLNSNEPFISLRRIDLNLEIS
ncbi:CD2 antigen cytoplasmic tail-binding protein 2 [Cichlidogyrus casuarinus]|uniref:CD2 antigen cytoplasmic tail-binding protein 2 n=1 Tax=Cichlidogyrus casuarinus TaxID=1844966 RepID=A0ABD2QKB1_9PLAT